MVDTDAFPVMQFLEVPRKIQMIKVRLKYKYTCAQNLWKYED